MLIISRPICRRFQASFFALCELSSVVLPISWFQTLTLRKPQKAYNESPLILNFFVAFMFIQLLTVIGTENITITMTFSFIQEAV